MLPFRSVKNFYPRPPRGGRPPAVARGYPSAKISIHALREEGDAGPQLRERPERISIHALREEGDEEGPKVFRLKTNFYPRPPRGGRPLTVRLSALPRSFLSTPSARRATSASLPCRSPARFLSTPSARRATRSAATRRRRCSNFYPRPPRGGRRESAGLTIRALAISIHALREEGDNAFTANERAALLFLSTPSARRATRLNFRASSIVGYFYPRPPRGGRRAVHRPLRGCEDISIHALREEGDS